MAPKPTPPEVAKSFSSFLQTIGQGELHHRLTEALQELNAAMNQHVQDFGGSPKGKIVLTIDFQLKKGVFDILGNFSTKKPKWPGTGTVMWSTQGNNFTTEHPSQINMFPRKVGDVPHDPETGEIIDETATAAK